MIEIVCLVDAGSIRRKVKCKELKLQRKMKKTEGVRSYCQLWLLKGSVTCY